MRIAVNTRLLLPGKLDGIGWFTHEVMRRLVFDYPQHEFLFLFDRNWSEEYVYNTNVTAKSLRPQTRHPLLYRMYFEYSIPLALRQWKADLFFSPDGFLSTKTRVPQVAVMHDINFEHRPQDLPKAYSNYYRTFFPRFAHIAREIITVSDYSANDISATYGIDRAKIHVAHNGGNEAYRKLSDDEKTKARKIYTLGNPYFLFVGNFSQRKNVHGIIKAYDRYRSFGGKSSLVLAGNALWRYAEMDEALNKSPNAADIHLPGHVAIDTMVQLMGGAQALLFPSYFEGFGIPVVEAFRAEIPVITSNTTSLPEVAAGAAVLVDPDDTHTMALSMVDVEESREKFIPLILSGAERARVLTWENCANKVGAVLFPS